jgi:hypothetical protein
VIRQSEYAEVILCWKGMLGESIRRDPRLLRFYSVFNLLEKIETLQEKKVFSGSRGLKLNRAFLHLAEPGARNSERTFWLQTIQDILQEIIREIPKQAETETACKPPSQDPPSAAIFLLFLAPKKHRDPLLGDLEEDFHNKVLPRVGLRSARFWFWWQVIISLAPLVLQQLRKIVGLGLLWKFIGR